MKFIFGIVLLLTAVSMFIFGRSRSAEAHHIPLMNVWALGQIYVLAVLVCLVMGSAFVINNWPL